jgi:hypothetical protein
MQLPPPLQRACKFLLNHRPMHCTVAISHRMPLHPPSPPPPPPLSLSLSLSLSLCPSASFSIPQEARGEHGWCHSQRGHPRRTKGWNTKSPLLWYVWLLPPPLPPIYGNAPRTSTLKAQPLFRTSFSNQHIGRYYCPQPRLLVQLCEHIADYPPSTVPLLVPSPSRTSTSTQALWTTL